MSKTHWIAEAPSNIALIKYMGKTDHSANVATNPSLSMSLGKFTTIVEIEKLAAGPEADEWEPLATYEAIPAKSGERFLRFFAKLKAAYGAKGFFRLRSGNNFPSDCGLASSASSFAALTRAADFCFSDILGQARKSPLELAQLSRQGSGSSCRSFFSPWCAWEDNAIYSPPSKLAPLIDLVVILTDSPKKVSSSEAHQRVASSPLMEFRTERVLDRQRLAKSALTEGNFQKLAEIAWAEFWDMHSMFHTAVPPFFYFEPGTIEVLRFAEQLWEKHGFGPIATIDAGPNVHLLVKQEERGDILARLREKIGDGIRILESGA